MSLVNYLGTYETLDQVWETYPEGGKEGDYLYIASVLKKWNKYTSAWVDATQEDVEGSTIMSLEEDVVVGSSTLINYLGRFETLENAINTYPEGGNEGDYIYVGDDIYAWDKYANGWFVSLDAPLEVAISEEDIIPDSNTFINYLGGFVDRDAVWQKYPEGGKVGDYLYIASDLHIWDKYICNWVAATPPDESSQIRPIEHLSQEGVVEYSENYINYLGVFESIEQAWEAYPEGGKEGDYIIVDGEQLRWNKYTSNWGEYDPDASTPARPVATIYGDLHVHNDVIIGEDLYARILETFTTKKWVLEQGYISLDDVTSELVMSKIVPDNTTIEVRDGKLVVIGGGGGGTADSVAWDNITGKPEWIGDTKPTYTLDEIAGSNGDGFVTLLSDQTIEGVKNFANGAKFNGALLSYDEEKKAWVFPGNIIASGGITAFGSLSTPVASLFEALPIDGTTIKRDPITNELYVDTNVVGGSGGGSLDEAQLADYLARNLYTTEGWVYSQLDNYALKSAIPTDYLTQSGEQDVFAVKNFTQGVQIGGLPIRKGADNMIYIDANLAVSGSVTIFGKDSTTFPTIWANIPFDDTMRWDGSRWSVVASTGGGGGVADSVAWADVTGKPSWIGSTKPTYSWTEITGKPTTLSAFTNDSGFITASSSITGNAATSNRLVEEVVTDLNNATVGRIFTMTSGYGSTAGNKPTDNWVTGLTLQYALNGEYRRQLAFGGGGLYFREESNTNWGNWHKILDSNNYSNYALSKDGTAVAASKLATARSIFGQSFDGSADVSGNIFPINANGCYYNEHGISYHTNKQYQVSILRVTSSYDVAIGGTTALDKLHVYGRGRFVMQRKGDQSSIVPDATALTISTNSAGHTGYNTGIGFNALGDYSNFAYKNHIHAWIGLGSAQTTLTAECYPLVFATNAKYSINAAPIERMRITPDGNVAIGGTTASEKLHVYGNIKSTGDLDGGVYFLRSSNAANPLLRLAVGSQYYYVQAMSDAIYLGATSATSLKVTPTGDTTVRGNLLATGAITMYYSSDERLKKNIRKVNASKTLMSLGGVYQYEYIDSEVSKNSTYDGSHYGLIYQNVKGTALKSMCHEREDGYGALNYLDTNFISLIAGATMENISEVEKLKKENKALRKEVELLKQRVA